MSLPTSWKWLKVATLLIGLFIFWTLPMAGAQSNSLEHPWKLLEEHRQNILHLSSDKEALKFNQTFMPHQEKPQHLHTRRQPPRGKQPSSHPIPQEMQATLTTFWAAMAAIGYIQELRATREVSTGTHFFTEIPTPDAPLQWIASKSSLEGFTQLVTFQKQLLTWPKQELTPLPPDHVFFQFAKFFDQPELNADRQTWINIFNERGFQGIQDRLREYWQQGEQQNVHHPLSDSLKQTYIQHYVESRLFPILHSHLLTQLIQADTQAANVAWESWHRIQEWQQQEQAHYAMRRLCGTWKWLIHNHQNHGDHKTTMTFDPPGQSTPSQVQPSNILIHGDTVYLKWTFPQGIQEDSLLLSNHDARLEGTFTNSLGPHGSISGQRLSPCQD